MDHLKRDMHLLLVLLKRNTPGTFLMKLFKTLTARVLNTT